MRSCVVHQRPMQTTGQLEVPTQLHRHSTLAASPTALAPLTLPPSLPPQVCKYIDIPLQHISNLTLLAMNRPPQVRHRG